MEDILEVCECKIYLRKILANGISWPFYEGWYKGQKVMVRFSKSKEISEQELDFIDNETSILNKYDFPHIIQRTANPLYDSEYIVLIYEYYNQGSIANYIRDKKLDIETFKEIIHQITKTISVLHIHKSCLLAINEHSVCIDIDNNNFMRVAIADLMYTHDVGKSKYEFIEREFMAKDACAGNINFKVDLYSLGVLVENLRKFIDKIPDEKCFMDFINECKNPAINFDIELGGVIQHPFLKRNEKLSLYKKIDDIGKDKSGNKKGGMGDISCNVVVMSDATKIKGQIFGRANENAKSQVVLKKCNLKEHKIEANGKTNCYFAREIMTLYAVSAVKEDRKYCVYIYDHFCADGNIYIVEEYFPEGDLTTQIKRADPIRLAKIIYSICECIEMFHRIDIILRDLKPPNILIENLVKGTVKFCDFGLVKPNISLEKQEKDPKQAENIDHSPSTIAGSIEYMAPEYRVGLSQDKSIDIWSLGIIIFELVYGYKQQFMRQELWDKFDWLKNANEKIKYNSSILEIIKMCLQYESKKRASLQEIKEFIKAAFKF